MYKNEKGFSFVELLIIIVIVGLVGTVGWVVLGKQKSKQPIDNDGKTTNQQSTKKIESNAADTNEGYLVLKEWGLRFKTPSGLTDVKYVINGNSAAFFAKPTGSNVQYRSDYDRFAGGNFQYATGVLYRSTDSSKTIAGKDETTQGKKLGDYYYYTAWSFSSLATGAACVGLYGDESSNCEPEGTAFKLVNQGDSALLNTIEIVQ